MNYFIVFQKKTFKEEKHRGILWAPKTDSSNTHTYYFWKSLLEAKKGDVVFSVVNNSIIARSTVIHEAVESPNPFSNDLWSREGWLVKLEYYLLTEIINIRDNFTSISNYLPDHHSPFNKTTGRGNQGYFYPIPKDLGLIIDNLVKGTYISETIDDIYLMDDQLIEEITNLLESEGLEEGKITLVETAPPHESNKPRYKKTIINARKIDYLEKAKKDTKTGLIAEMLVVDHEKDFLIQNNRPDLATKVRWVANDDDSQGYDILSYDLTGNDKYIEVKATKLGLSQPFDITANEIKKSIEKKDNYWVYRVYYADTSEPKFYKVQGNVETNFDLEPTLYKAYIK